MRPELRVLYVQPAPLFGGAERQAVEQAACLRSLGIDVTVFTGPGTTILEWLESKGVDDVVASRNFPGRWPKQKGLMKATLPFRVVHCGVQAREELEALVSREHYDVMVASLPFSWITATLVARRHGIPIAWRAGGAYINPVQAGGMWAVTRVVRPDLLICNSRAVEATFGRVIPTPVEILPNGVDTEQFRPDAGDTARYRPPDARLVVGYAGRLATRKRPQDLIALAARLRTSVPGARVILAGEGSRRSEYERRARALGADNVRFLGYVADMPAFYAACDIVVLPSSSEGSSNTVLEAMASGKPVVASDIPPLAEQIRDGETGLLFPLGDVDALAREVAYLARDPEIRRRLAERGLEHARRSTISASAERLAQVLERLAGERGSHRAPVPTPRPELRVVR